MKLLKAGGLLILLGGVLCFFGFIWVEGIRIQLFCTSVALIALGAGTLGYVANQEEEQNK